MFSRLAEILALKHWKGVVGLQSFFCRTKIVAGPGARQYLRELGAKRVFLVTDRFFSESGTASETARMASETFEIFDGVQPDPSAELVARGTARLRDFGPDLVVALGGGSPMDCAKAMVYFSGAEIPIAAIPTTSGSGSEVTDFAIITHNEVKHPLVSESLRPQVAILDSDLLEKLPRSLIADAGFDVLSHALEALAATGAGGITDALATESFRTALALLPASYGGDTTVRLRIHVAASMAAMAFSQAGLGICHALSHSLGGQFHVPHGRLNAILLPAVLSVNARAAGSQYAAAARAAGLGGSAETIALRNLKNALVRLRKELKLPATLSGAGVAPGDLKRNMASLVEAALADPCCKTNPVTPTAGMLEEVLWEVAGHDSSLRWD